MTTVYASRDDDSCWWEVTLEGVSLCVSYDLADLSWMVDRALSASGDHSAHATILLDDGRSVHVRPAVLA